MAAKFVLDTSLFVNPYARKKFGKDPPSAAAGFIREAKKLDVDFYIPPSVFNELRNFIGKKSDDLALYVKKRAPNTFSIHLPAAVFYDFRDDVRSRVNKGLRLAEDFAKDNHPDNDAKLAKLREKYRDSMRTGIIDSKEDLELVLLAKELDATIVTADEGVMKFAHKLGCQTLDADKFHAKLKAMGKRKRK